MICDENPTRIMVLTYHEQRSRSFSFNSSGHRSINCPSLASSSQVSSFVSEDDESFDFHLHSSTVGVDDDCIFEVDHHHQDEMAKESTFQAQMAEEKVREMEFILHQQLSSSTTAAATTPRPIQEEDSTPLLEWESFESSYDGHNSLMNLVVTTKDQEDGEFARPLSPMTSLDEYDTTEDEERKLIVRQQISQIRSCLEQTRQMQYQLLQTLAMTTYYYSDDDDEDDDEKDMYSSHFTATELPETQPSTDFQKPISSRLNSSSPTNNNITRYRRHRRRRCSSPTSNSYFNINLLWFGLVVMAFLLGMMTNTDTHIVFKSKVITPIQKYFPQPHIFNPQQQSLNQQCVSA